MGQRQSRPALTVVHLLGAVAAFIAIGIHTASQSPVGRLLPAGESPGFVWLREHSAVLVWCPLVWLLAVALLRQAERRRRPQAARAAGVQRWLAAAELGAIIAVAFTVARPWNGFLALAHGVLQASIMLQALTAPRLEEPAPVHFLDLPERHHWPFLGGAFGLAALPLLLDPGVRRLARYVVLDSDFERALSRTLPALLSGITALWAAAGLLGLLGAARAIWRLVPLDSPLRPALDRLPFVLACGVTTTVQPPFDDPRMGISLVPLLTGAERERYLRRDVVGRASFKRTYFLYRDWRWKLTWSAEFDLLQLFDVASDPAERRNLLQESPVLAAELERDLLTYLARVERRLYRPALEANPRQSAYNTATSDLIPAPFNGRNP